MSDAVKPARQPKYIHREEQWRVCSRHRVTHNEFYGLTRSTGFWGSRRWARRQALWWLRQLEAKFPEYVYWLEPGDVELIPVYD